MTDQNNAAHDLRTSKGGRAYIAEYFATQLGRHDFTRYISDTLAADFACALAQHLSKLRAPVADERDADMAEPPQPESIVKGHYRPETVRAIWELKERYRLALASAPVAVTAGYALVPIEPTPDMIEAGATERITPHASAGHGAVAGYKAMLAAAPAASAPVADERISDETLWSWATQVMGGPEAHHVGMDRVLRYARTVLASAPVAGEAHTIVYPPDGTESPFTVINLGTGAVQMGPCLHDGRIGGLWFGKDGQGMGHEQVLDRYAHPGETIAVVTFANVEGLDVMLGELLRCREQYFPDAKAAPQASEADDLIGALGQCRDAFPVPASAGSPLDFLWQEAMSNPAAVPVYVKACAAQGQASEAVRDAKTEGFLAGLEKALEVLEHDDFATRLQSAQVISAIRAQALQADKDGGDCAKGGAETSMISPESRANACGTVALPPLGNSPGGGLYHTHKEIKDYARAAVLADRQQRGGDASEQEKMRDVLQWIVDDAASGGVAKLRPQQEKRARAALSAQPAKEPANPNASPAASQGAAAASGDSLTGKNNDGGAVYE